MDFSEIFLAALQTTAARPIPSRTAGLLPAAILPLVVLHQVPAVPEVMPAGEETKGSFIKRIY